jgi:hypothetical protein
LHVVWTMNWLDAARCPITWDEVNLLIQADPELEWSASEFMETNGMEDTARFYMISWKGRSSFWWYRDQILCATPDEQQVAKLIEIATKLNAHTIGDDGEKYMFSRNLLGQRKIKAVQP